MASMSFDDPAVLAAMRAYFDASTALESAGEEAEVLSRSDAKAVAGMQLRKRLLEHGWSAPIAQRSST